ncbi:hypothetical protein O181_029126 [Austropuccinia psidii MF-1]|uniref:Uncharacterized protein n=1 Tax=Austropuccinia psidii MF-1 TaxID=1389203 RepID=A0A9Q3CVV6_9BASI|nr:hypothetical protein [Austropuccinia psidii MF-1]
MNPINHDPNHTGENMLAIINLKFCKDHLFLQFKTTPSHSLRLLLTAPDIVNSVEDKEAVQKSGPTDYLSDEYVAQHKDSSKK